MEAVRSRASKLDARLHSMAVFPMAPFQRPCCGRSRSASAWDLYWGYEQCIDF